MPQQCRHERSYLLSRLLWCAIAICPVYSGEQQSTACAANLRKTIEAIQAYRRQHDGRYPGTLAELANLGLIESTALQCPQVLAELEGSAPTTALATSTSLQGELRLAYEYELAENRIVHPLRKTPFSRRDLKLLLLSREYWQQVPLVRCRGHADAPSSPTLENPLTHLNATANGDVYRSPEYWEEVWIEYVPYTNRTESVVDGLRGPPYSSGMPISLTGVIDCRTWNNSFGDHPWWYGVQMLQHRFRPISAPVLAEFFEGEPKVWTSSRSVAYWIDGLVQLQGKILEVDGTVEAKEKTLKDPDYSRGFTRNAFPREKEAVLINRNFSQVSWLQATVWEGKRGEPVGWMVWHYEDGKTEKVPIRYGMDTARFWSDSTQEASEVDFVAPVWRQGTSEAGGQNPLTLRVYEQTWVNPRPKVPLATLDFVSNMDSAAGPLMISMSATPDA